MGHHRRHKLKVSPRPSSSPDLNILNNPWTYFQFLQDDPEISQHRKTLVARVLANPSNRDWNTLGSYKKPVEAVIPSKGWRYRALTRTVTQTLAVCCTYELFFSSVCMFFYSNHGQIRNYLLDVFCFCSPVFADCIGVTPLAVPPVQLANSYKNFTVKFHK